MTKVQLYKVGYYTDEWGMSSNTPCLVPDDSGYAVKFEDYCKLETELVALKAELREICAAIDDPACDLTLTTVECIKKLKAENESLQKDAARLDWVEHQDFDDLSFTMLVDQPNDGMTAVSISEGWHLGNNLREAIDAAMIAGEK